MRLEEVAVQLCRLKELPEFPLKYKADVERLILALNVISKSTRIRRRNVEEYEDMTTLKAINIIETSAYLWERTTKAEKNALDYALNFMYQSVIEEVR